jgi:hypothetical protein
MASAQALEDLRGWQQQARCFKRNKLEVLKAKFVVVGVLQDQEKLPSSHRKRN